MKFYQNKVFNLLIFFILIICPKQSFIEHFVENKNIRWKIIKLATTWQS